MIRQTFSQRLRALLEEKGLSQVGLAHRLAVSRPAVSRWLATGAIPYDRTLLRLADFFQVNPDWLRTGEGERNSEAIAQRQKDQAAFAEYLARGPEALSEKQASILENPFREFVVDADEATGIFEELIRFFGELAAENESKALEYRAKIRDLITHRDRQRAQLVKWHRELAASALKQKTRLLTSEITVTGSGMPLPANLDDLIDRARRATAIRGEKKALAIYLGVSQQQVSDWLRTKKRKTPIPKPGGEITLRMLAWVQAKEAQQKRDPEAALTAPGQVTQLRESSHENQKVRSKKASHKGTKRSIAKRGKR